jgi:hypothetical protein
MRKAEDERQANRAALGMSSGGHGDELQRECHVAVVHAHDEVLFVAVAADRRSLMGKLGGLGPRSCGLCLEPPCSEAVLESLERGEVEDAVSRFFQTLERSGPAVRWERQRLTTRRVKLEGRLTR